LEVEKCFDASTHKHLPRYLRDAQLRRAAANVTAGISKQGLSSQPWLMPGCEILKVRPESVLRGCFLFQSATRQPGSLIPAGASVFSDNRPGFLPG
jgi:hypothetical protein